ncbi:hypothetical protein BH10BAC3_BH10BAC3_28310 [soil metagenome]
MCTIEYVTYNLFFYKSMTMGSKKTDGDHVVFRIVFCFIVHLLV